MKRDVYGRVPVSQVTSALQEAREIMRAKEGDALTSAIGALHKINEAFPTHHKNRALVEGPLLELINDVLGISPD